MAKHLDLEAAKQRVSAAVMAMDAVSGVGISEGSVVVYLADDSTAARQAVTSKLNALTPQVPVRLVATGKFEKQEGN